MFKWFERAYRNKPELGALYIYECLVTPSPDNAMWSVLTELGGEDFRVDDDLLIKASHAIIETTKLNTKGTKHE